MTQPISIVITCMKCGHKKTILKFVEESTELVCSICKCKIYFVETILNIDEAYFRMGIPFKDLGYKIVNGKLTKIKKKKKAKP